MTASARTRTQAQASHTCTPQSTKTTMSDSRCRACTVAVPKARQRRNLSSPASRYVVPTRKAYENILPAHELLDHQLLFRPQLRIPKLSNRCCYSQVSVAQAPGSQPSRSHFIVGLALPRYDVIQFYVQATISLALSDLEQSTRKHGVLVQTYFSPQLVPKNTAGSRD